ncbi:MAG TPA: 2OG-Fe(II) oxygenase [Methylococcaceae bacterium]|nr:2OG-Fe(II) oxygenase [Methylococcaceae bacterium]HIA45240.1 2OG-Fe(II) oxygenase [Methylococcaceae bacterium]HIN68594.1 2OG-Fe(II) oxygenase [Methylococcales bacterium]
MSHIQMIDDGNSLFISSNNVNNTETINAYQKAKPFPHIVLDDFFPNTVIKKITHEFPEANSYANYNNDRERYKKAYNPDDLKSSYLRSLFYSFNAKPFLTYLENLTGIPGLIPDPDFNGAGFHEIGTGGHLGIHADFNIHNRLKLKRRINVLIYLNESWQEEYGGHLELWEKDMSKKALSIAPLMNRCVIFNTESDTFHGHPDPLKTPKGITRKSIALYYYTASDAILDEYRAHSTLFETRENSSDKRDTKRIVKGSIKDLCPPMIYRKYQEFKSSHK